MPYLTISDEQRLKLKNRELEIRMKEDEERFKRAIEEHVKQKDNRLTVIESQIKTLLTSLSSIKNQNQVKEMVRTLHSSGILNTVNDESKQ